MRIPLAAALLLLATPLASSAQATGGPTPFRTPHFEVTLPRGYPVPGEQTKVADARPIVSYVSVGTRVVLAIVQLALPQIPTDSALEARRQAFRAVRESLMPFGGFHPVGEPREIVREDRLTYRMPGTGRGRGDQPLRGAMDVSLSRRGGTHAWIVSHVAAGGPESPEGIAFMDSFRLRPDAPPAFPPDTTDVFRWIEGRWAPVSAGPPPFRVRVGRDRATIRLEYDAGDPIASVFQVLGHGPDHIRGRMVGETRGNSTGAPLVGDFVRISKDLFCFRGVDRPYGCSVAMRRVTPAPEAPPETPR